MEHKPLDQPKLPALKGPNVSEIFDLGPSGVLLVTSVDWHKLQGTFAFFQTADDAREFVHEASLRQFPKWHEEKCSTCRKRAKK